MEIHATRGVSCGEDIGVGMPSSDSPLPSPALPSMQLDEPALTKIELSPRSALREGYVEGKSGKQRDAEAGTPVSQIDPAATPGCVDGPHKLKATGTAVPSKLLRNPPIEETDGEQVLYPRQPQISELPQKLIPEPLGEPVKPPSESKCMRTFALKPLFGKDRAMDAHRMRRRFTGIPSSDPESYVRSRTTRWGRLDIFDRPASASPITSPKSRSPILLPPCAPAPPSNPVQPILNSERNAANRSGTYPVVNKSGIVTSPSLMPAVPPTRKTGKPLSVVVPEAENKKTISGLLDLTGRITRPNNYPSAHGGFADVWTGHWQAESGVRKVAVKVLRSHSDNEQAKKRLNKKLRRELRVWQRLHHENVIPLYGVTSNFGPYTSMVCPWMENGTLNNYLANTGSSLRLSDRFRILREVAAGLSYLHSFDVIHGDLTGSNVLISDKGQAMLSDFGLSTIVAEFQGTSYFTSSIRGAVRWAAREIYVINEADPALSVSTHSDVYSFGSVMLQTLSDKVPYHYLRNDALVLLQLDKGVYPQRPLEAWVTDDLWTFINRCWVKNPPNRPTIREVLAFIDFHYYACALT